MIQSQRLLSFLLQGKRHDNYIKTTDLLIRLYEKVINHLDYHDRKREIIQRYDDIVKELQMDGKKHFYGRYVTLEHYINQLKNERRCINMDYFLVVKILMPIDSFI